MADDDTPFRHRHDGWTPVRQQRFLKMLALTGCVADAAKAVGLTTTSAYRAKQRIEAFSAGWELALESVAPVLYATAYERAVEGWEEDVWYHGKVVGKRRRFDNNTLRFMIERGNRTELRRPPTEKEKLAAAHAAARAVGMKLYEAKTSADTDRLLREKLARIAKRMDTPERARAQAERWAAKAVELRRRRRRGRRSGRCRRRRGTRVRLEEERHFDKLSANGGATVSASPLGLTLAKVRPCDI